eukprot:CFRG5544T1
MYVKERRVAVFGSTGRTGRVIVRLLVESGFKVTLVARNAETAHEVFASLQSTDEDEVLTVVQGDLLRMPVETINNILKSCEFCICAVGSRRFSNVYKDVLFRPEGNHPYFIDYLGVARIAGGCERVGTIKRLVVLSSAGVLRPWHPVSFFHNVLLSMVLKYKIEGERAVRAKNISYTIIRPGRLTNGRVADPRNLKVDQGDRMSGMNGISRETLGRLCIAAMLREDITRLTIDVDSITFTPLTSASLPLLNTVPNPEHSESKITDNADTQHESSDSHYDEWMHLFDDVKPDAKVLPEVYHSFPIAITVLSAVVIPLGAWLLFLFMNLVGLR